MWGHLRVTKYPTDLSYHSLLDLVNAPLASYTLTSIMRKIQLTTTNNIIFYFVDQYVYHSLFWRLSSQFTQLLPGALEKISKACKLYLAIHNKYMCICLQIRYKLQIYKHDPNIISLPNPSLYLSFNSRSIVKESIFMLKRYRVLIILRWSYCTINYL